MLTEERDNFLVNEIAYDSEIGLRIKVNIYSLIYVDNYFFSVFEFLTV